MNTSILYRKHVKFVIIIGISSIIFALIIFLHNIFQIKNIEVMGSGVSVIVDDHKVPKNLLFLPIEVLKNRIISDNPLLKSVELKKKFPHTLVIIPVPRVAIATLATDTQTVVVDEYGLVLSLSVGTEKLPKILVPLSTVRIGDFVNDERVKVSTSFLKNIQTLLTIDTVAPFDRFSFLAKMGETDILFSQQKEIPTQARTLQTLFAGFRIKGSMPARIDLRFEKPIVTF